MAMNKSQRWGLFLAGFLLWMVLSVLMGVAFLAVKHSMGWGFFSSTGYHAFTGCMAKQMEHVGSDDPMMGH